MSNFAIKTKYGSFPVEVHVKPPFYIFESFKNLGITNSFNSLKTLDELDYYPTSLETDLLLAEDVPTTSSIQYIGSKFQYEKDRETTIILLNALGVTRNKYSKVIEGLSAKGFTVVSADYPCCGENKPTINKSVDYDYNILVNEYIPKLIEAAKAHNPNNQILLLGHSLGGHIATLYATSYGQSVIGVASGSVHYKSWEGKGRIRMLSAVATIKSLLAIYGYLPGYKIGLGAKETKTLMTQWCQTALTGKFKFMTVSLTPKDGKGLYLNIDGDNFAPFKSTQSLANLCAHSKVIQVKLDTKLKGNPHGIWIKNPKPVIDAICENIKYLTT
ncbi:alpha/beta hydrolase [Psychrobacter sp.]|uniref:alpha/beta fold hydrolase n=1 Tax=Psychrobacter sp. TaxID=56811 RepID=UPI0025F679FF|nr:alpha/beta hydrolase [Psychrobacter sp.]